jgi:hypothetical protein
MFIFPSDYKALYTGKTELANKVLLNKLENIIRNHTVLFIGCGLGDHQINTIFKEIFNIQQGYANKHFIITKSKIPNNLDYLRSIEVENYDSDILEILDKLLQYKGKTKKTKPS